MIAIGAEAPDARIIILSTVLRRCRDTVRFSNGHQLRLQEMHEDRRVLVLDVSLAEPYEPGVEGFAARSPLIRV
jgi:hypothetical protein